MTTAPDHTSQQVHPVEIVQPTETRAIRALKALAENRIKDAQTNVDALGDSPIQTLAWKLFLQGTIHGERREFSTALPVLVRSVSAALVAAFKMESAVDGEAIRLSASGLERIGRIRRRQDRPEDACRAHVAAYLLRQEHGSHEEVWESALSLGVDAELAGRPEEARAWYQTAIHVGAAATHDSMRKQAVAWSNVSVSLRQSGRHVEAVDAAKTARDCWCEHDVGAVDTARADMNLGHALLGLGESLHDQDSREAQVALREAVEWLTAAHEALLPYGPEAAPDVQWCLDQLDFARRLLVALQG